MKRFTNSCAFKRRAEKMNRSSALRSSRRCGGGGGGDDARATAPDGTDNDAQLSTPRRRALLTRAGRRRSTKGPPRPRSRSDGRAQPKTGKALGGQRGVKWKNNTRASWGAVRHEIKQPPRYAADRWPALNLEKSVHRHVSLSSRFHLTKTRFIPGSSSRMSSAGAMYRNTVH